MITVASIRLSPSCCDSLMNWASFLWEWCFEPCALLDQWQGSGLCAWDLRRNQSRIVFDHVSPLFCRYVTLLRHLRRRMLSMSSPALSPNAIASAAHCSGRVFGSPFCELSRPWGTTSTGAARAFHNWDSFLKMLLCSPHIMLRIPVQLLTARQKSEHL